MYGLIVLDHRTFSNAGSKNIIKHQVQHRFQNITAPKVYFPHPACLLAPPL